MGFLGSILKVIGSSATDSAKRSINNEVSKKIEEQVTNKVGKVFDSMAKDTSAPASSAPVASTSVAKKNYAPPRKSLTANQETIRTANIIREQLSRYSSIEVKEDYSIAGSSAQNVSFAIFQNGAPKLYVMIVGKTTCTSHAYLETKRKAEQEGVKLINFVEHFRNDPAYVDTRLAENFF